MTPESIKKRFVDSGWLLATTVVGGLVVACVTGLFLREKIAGLSYLSKVIATLNTGVPLWFVLLLAIFAVWAGWELYSKPEVRQVGETHYYFMSGRDQPYCQPCYDGGLKKLVPVTPQHRYAGGLGRRCLVCGKTFFESHDPPEPPEPKYTGPDAWMAR